LFQFIQALGRLSGDAVHLLRTLAVSAELEQDL
jgi:hypothetical protein